MRSSPNRDRPGPTYDTSGGSTLLVCGCGMRSGPYRSLREAQAAYVRHSEGQGDHAKIVRRNRRMAS